MQFDMRNLFLHGLMAVASASPVPQTGSGTDELSNIAQENASASTTTTPNLDTRDLETRAKKKSVTSFNCNGVILAKDDVGSAVSKMKGAKDRTVGSYPHEFKNGENTFAGTSKKLREFPIIQGGTFNGVGPGPYRAVTDYNNAFVGVMWEKAVGAKMTRCTPVTDTNTAAAQQTTAAKQDTKTDKKDDKKDSKTGKTGKTKGH